MALDRRHWLASVGLEIVLFVLSNVVAKNAKHPGTASQILWAAFLIGLLTLVVLGAAALVRSRRSRAS